MSRQDRQFLAALVALATAAIIFGTLCLLSLVHDFVSAREEVFPNVIVNQPNIAK